MTRDFLKSLGIEDKAVIDQIMGENGKDIEAEKAKFGDYDSLKKSADDYKAKFEQAQADSKKQLDEIRFNHALEDALKGAKARNVKAVRALLETEKLKPDKDGCLTGLSEQLEALKKDSPYLFEEEKKEAPAFLGGAGAGGVCISDYNAVRTIMGLPPISN